MMQTKLTPDLSRQLARTKESEMLDIIIEVRQSDCSLNESLKNEKLSRQEQILVRQKNFDNQSAPIEDVVQQVGGEIVGRVWINQTLKARVPAKSVKKISEHRNISILDLPHLIEKD